LSREALRIALVAGEDPGWGGIGTYTLELARGLVAEGHHVELVLRGWEEDGVELLDGLTVHRVTVPPPSWRRGTVALLSRAHAAREAAVFSSRVAQVVARLHRGDGLDVVEAPEFHAPGLAAALRSRARAGTSTGPVIAARVHAPGFLTPRLAGEPATADTRLLERLERAAVRSATLVTAPSAAMANEVARRWGADLRRRVQVVPNPIDVDRFAPLDVLEDAATLLLVGRVEHNKGQDVAVEALPAILEAVPGTRLVLVGADSELAAGGSAQAALRARVAQLGLPEDALVTTGALRRDELRELYARATACLVPSRFEAFGYTCVEAMSCGRPVVASAAGGLAEIVSDGNDGVLVQTGDPEALGQAAIRLLTDPDLRRSLGQAARASVELHFAAPTVARQMCALYIDAASAGTIGDA
jgi:glycogen(starch) synthase